MIRTQKVWFHGLAIVLSLVLVFGVLEAIGSVGLHQVKEEPEPPEEIRRTHRLSNRKTQTIPDPYLTYRVKPNLDWGHIRTNEYGLRSDPIEPRPDDGTFRILLLGGSVAWGSTARSNDETPAALLEEYLQQRSDRHPVLRGRRIEVLNGGVPAYVAWQSALSYSIYHRKLEPRVVISLDGANEVSAAIRTGRAGAPMRFDITRKSYLKERPSLFRGIVDWLAYRYGRLKFVRFVKESRPAGIDALAPPPQAVAHAYRDALEHLSDVARAEGALAVPVLQPMLVLSNTKRLTPFEHATIQYEEDMMPGRTAYYQACFDAMRTMYLQLAVEQPDLLLLDATGIFAGEERVTFTDPAHLTRYGRGLLVRGIGEKVLRRLTARGS